MHRHVARHLPRQRQHGVPLASTKLHNQNHGRPYSTTKNPSKPNPDSSAPEPEAFAADLPSPETLRAVLSNLNHQTLLDTHRKLNAFAAHLTSLPKTLPKHLRSTSRAPAGETAPYILSYNRHLLAEIERKVHKVVARVEHTRAHVGDLLEEEYASTLPSTSTSTSTTPADGAGAEGETQRPDPLRAWREHVARLGTAAAKAEELTELRYREEADEARMRGSAAANLRLVRELRARVAGERRGTVWRWKGEGGEARKGEEVREEGGGAVVEGETRKEEKEEGPSLLELQERLRSGMS